MNLDHLRAFVWLRWRLLANQVTKGHLLNKVLLILFAVGGVVSSIGLFIGGFIIGVAVFALPDLPSSLMLVVWDGLVVAFLLFWSGGTLAELQRSEALSVDKFLHLPVSLAGVFVLNYLSSLFSISLLMFAPMMVGFSLGLALSKGPAMLLVLPLLAAFFLMVTALTYQFQGWLASLMLNKRRRRAIAVVLTLVFVLLFQLPNLLNFYFKPWKVGDPNARTKKMKELNRALEKKDINPEEFEKQVLVIQQEHGGNNAAPSQETWRHLEQPAWIASLVLPPGWLAVGAWSASEGGVLPALIGAFGMGLIGVASLWRAYRTSLRLYTGQFTAGTRTPAPVIAPEPKPSLGQPRAELFLERKFSSLSEPAAVIALATFRSLTRAPEAKALLLSPLFIVLVFAGVLSQIEHAIPDLLRPLVACGIMGFMITMIVSLVSNQFGYDRSGFKVYVLSPATRRDLLLGKNLAILPFAAALTALILVVVEVMIPMPIGYGLALPFEFLSMYLLLCLLANTVSILGPMPVAAGAMKPVSPKVIPLLMQFAMLFAAQIVLMVVMLPWAVEAGLTALQAVEGIPICLTLSALESVAVVLLYRWLLGWQGRLLQHRELTILETVTTKAE